MTIYVIHNPLKSTLGLINLYIRCLNPTLLFSFSVRQYFHSLRSQGKACWARIDSQDIERLLNLAIVVVELVALAAFRTVPALDGRCTCNQWVFRERVEGREALLDEAVGAVRAGHGVERGASLVEFLLDADGNRTVAQEIRVSVGRHCVSRGEGEERGENKGLHFGCME